MLFPVSLQNQIVSSFSVKFPALLDDFGGYTPDITFAYVENIRDF